VTLVGTVIGLVACTVAFIGGMRFGITVQYGNDVDRVQRILRAITPRARSEYETAALHMQQDDNL
jgi:hypothetical protein